MSRSESIVVANLVILALVWGYIGVHYFGHSDEQSCPVKSSEWVIAEPLQFGDNLSEEAYRFLGLDSHDLNGRVAILYIPAYIEQDFYGWSTYPSEIRKLIDQTIDWIIVIGDFTVNTLDEAIAKIHSRKDEVNARYIVDRYDEFPELAHLSSRGLPSLTVLNSKGRVLFASLWIHDRVMVSRVVSQDYKLDSP